MTYQDILSTDTTLVMGVINVTPDSFSDGGDFVHAARVVERAQEMVAEGADIIDIGAESTRPGAALVSSEEELARLHEVIPAVRNAVDTLLSLDTRRPEVARFGLTHGVDIINDVTGLTDPEMVAVCKEHDPIIVIMHMLGEPQTMQENPEYADVVSDVREYLHAQCARAEEVGLQKLIIDPGIGFGKTVEHNLSLLKNLEVLTEKYPVLVGLSRKSFIGKISGIEDPKDRLMGSIAGAVIAATHGARIIRTHDVRETREALEVSGAVRNS